MKPLLTFGMLCLALVIVSCNGLADDNEPFKDACANDLVSGIVLNQGHANLSEKNGTVTIKAFGGHSPYSFALDDGDFQTSNTFVGLGAGDYSVAIKDDKGCMGSTPVRIIESHGNPPSFQNTIMPMIAANCATSGCHLESGNAPLAFIVHAQIKLLAERIKIRTEDRTMPPIGSPQLTNDQIRLIAQWVDAGAPNN